MRLFIFRHGETFETKNNTLYKGDRIEKAEILSEGTEPLERLGHYLSAIKTNANFSSPYLRCRQSVEIIEKKSNKKFIYDDRLAEFIEGFWAFGKLRSRLQSFLNELQEKEIDQAAICTHGAVIAGIKHLLLNNSFHLWNLTDFPKPGVLWVIKDKLEETNFN
jgi:broad specificity phosphatase PhoE